MMPEAVGTGAPTAITQVASGSHSVAAPNVSATMASQSALTARPARKQVTHREVENMRQAHDKLNQTGLTYNIWWNQWSGGDYEDDRKGNHTKAEKRVNVARDAGYTRGNKQGSAYICLFFARGHCPNGADCTFLHTLPIDTPDQGHDVFGREKHGDYRDDMGGVGTIQRVNRTLYVGRIVEEPDSGSRISSGGGANRSSSGGGGGKDVKWNAHGHTIGAGSGGGSKGWNRSMDANTMSGTERVLHRHFGEFGELERIRVLHSRGCGFVTYVREVDAQFAKEAMMRQSLDHDECINLRWATDDPNPGAQKRDRRQREREGLQAIEANMSAEARAAGQSLLALETVDGNGDEEEGHTKRTRLEATQLSNEMTEDEYQRLVEENERNWAAMERQEAEEEKEQQQQQQHERRSEKDEHTQSNQRSAAVNDMTSSSSLLSAKAFEALQNMRKKQQQGIIATTPVQHTPASALGTLADYGSDSE